MQGAEWTWFIEPRTCRSGDCPLLLQLFGVEHTGAVKEVVIDPVDDMREGLAVANGDCGTPAGNFRQPAKYRVVSGGEPGQVGVAGAIVGVAIGVVTVVVAFVALAVTEETPAAQRLATACATSGAETLRKASGCCATAVTLAQGALLPWRSAGKAATV